MVLFRNNDPKVQGSEIINKVLGEQEVLIDNAASTKKFNIEFLRTLRNVLKFYPKRLESFDSLEADGILLKLLTLDSTGAKVKIPDLNLNPTQLLDLANVTGKPTGQLNSTMPTKFYKYTRRGSTQHVRAYEGVGGHDCKYWLTCSYYTFTMYLEVPAAEVGKGSKELKDFIERAPKKLDEAIYEKTDDYDEDISTVGAEYIVGGVGVSRHYADSSSDLEETDYTNDNPPDEDNTMGFQDFSDHMDGLTEPYEKDTKPGDPDYGDEDLFDLEILQDRGFHSRKLPADRESFGHPGWVNGLSCEVTGTCNMNARALFALCPACVKGQEATGLT